MTGRVPNCPVLVPPVESPPPGADSDFRQVPGTASWLGRDCLLSGHRGSLAAVRGSPQTGDRLRNFPLSLPPPSVHVSSMGPSAGWGELFCNSTRLFVRSVTIGGPVVKE